VSASQHSNVPVRAAAIDAGVASYAAPSASAPATAASAPATVASAPATAAWFLLALWLLGTAGAFWFFELGDQPLAGTAIQSFALAAPAPVETWFREQAAAMGASGASAAAQGAAAAVTLVRLHAPHCACDRAMAAASATIEARFEPRGVRFLDTADRRLRAAGVTAAPAALIFDAAGRLVYYGPYGNTAWCGTSGALVDGVLEHALRGVARFTTAPATRGCFCTA
jgi:hypothetical protein